MKRKQIEYGEPVEFTFTPRERTLILEHTFAGPDLADQFEIAHEKGGKIIVRSLLSG